MLLLYLKFWPATWSYFLKNLLTFSPFCSYSPRICKYPSKDFEFYFVKKCRSFISWRIGLARKIKILGWFFPDGKPLNLKVHFVATLVYIGNRPHPPRTLKFDFTHHDVAKNAALTAWLIERDIPVDDLIVAVSGKPLIHSKEPKMPIKMSNRLGPGAPGNFC